MKYHDPSFLVKYLYNASLTKNEKILNEANDALIDLKNSINRREIPKNENPDKASENLLNEVRQVKYSFH